MSTQPSVNTRCANSSREPWIFWVHRQTKCLANGKGVNIQCIRRQRWPTSTSQFIAFSPNRRNGTVDLMAIEDSCHRTL
jgi:hypothetical protein